MPWRCSGGAGDPAIGKHARRCCLDASIGASGGIRAIEGYPTAELRRHLLMARNWRRMTGLTDME